MALEEINNEIKITSLYKQYLNKGAIMKRLLISLILVSGVLLFSKTVFAQGGIAFYPKYTNILEKRSVPVFIQVFTNKNNIAKINFNKKFPNFKDKFNRFLMKANKIFNKNGRITYIEKFEPNPNLNAIYMSLVFKYAGKIYIENIKIHRNGEFRINKKFLQAFSENNRHNISYKMAEGKDKQGGKTKNLIIKEFGNINIYAGLNRNFGIVQVFLMGKLVAVKFPEVSSGFSHFKRGLILFENKWKKQEKDFLNKAGVMKS
ncbi:MAG: hypothetical protein ACYCTB_10000 [bacterium]